MSIIDATKDIVVRARTKAAETYGKSQKLDAFLEGLRELGDLYQAGELPPAFDAVIRKFGQLSELIGGSVGRDASLAQELLLKGETEPVRRAVLDGNHIALCEAFFADGPHTIIGVVASASIQERMRDVFTGFKG